MTSLENTNDQYALRVVERSNRRYELEQLLGREIITEINAVEDQMWDTKKTMALPLGASAVVGAGVAAALSSAKIQSRRQFLDSLLLGLFVGTGLGFFFGFPVASFIQDGRLHAYIDNVLIPKYKDKEELIKEYMQIRYPPMSL